MIPPVTPLISLNATHPGSNETPVTTSVETPDQAEVVAEVKERKANG